MKAPFFNKAGELITEIDAFLDLVDETSLIFQKGVRLFLNGEEEKFDSNLKRISVVENKADDYQKSIKYKLVKYMLIPDSRGDVLDLLESTDNVVDNCKKVLVHFSIEQPYIPDFLKNDFLELTTQSVQSVDCLVKGIRSYFNNLALVNDYIHKVHYYEHEADELEELLARKVFTAGSIKDLCLKTHLRYFISRIALISDLAESVSEKMAVAAIKRSI